MAAAQHDPHPSTVIFIEHDGVRYHSAVQFSNFIDGDSHCLVEDTAHIAGAKVIIKHYLYPNQNEQLIRLLLLAGTLDSLGARSIAVFVPYLPYARQDKAHFPGEAVAAELVCSMLYRTGIQTMYTIDCHFMKGASTSEVGGLHIRNTLVQGMLIERLEAELGARDYHIIGPDDGASYLAGGKTMKKARANDYSQHTDGSISRRVATLEDEHLNLSHDTLVVADDMVSTGSTMIKALQNLQARGIKNLYAMTSHGLFLKNSFETIGDMTAGLYYADTVPLKGAVPVVDAVFETILEKHF